MNALDYSKRSTSSPLYKAVDDITIDKRHHFSRESSSTLHQTVPVPSGQDRYSGTSRLNNQNISLLTIGFAVVSLFLVIMLIVLIFLVVFIVCRRNKRPGRCERRSPTQKSLLSFDSDSLSRPLSTTMCEKRSTREDASSESVL